MSRIDDLVAELCPDGVEYRALGDVGEFVRGNGLQKSDLTREGVPAIHYGQIHTYYGVWADSTKSFTSPELAVKLRRARPGDLIVVTTSEDDDAVAKATAWIGDSEVVVSGDAYIYRHSLEPRYVSYFFESEQFQTQKKRHISGTKVRRISGYSLAKIIIPVPPLEVQHEVVRILDKFTQLEEELESEQEARRRQYSFYCNFLLTFGEGVRRAPIGDIAELVRGNGMPKSDFVSDGVPAIHYGQIYTYYGTYTTETRSFVSAATATKLAKVDPGDVVITNTSENIEDVGKALAWLGETQAVTGGHATVIKHNENPKFLAYYFQTSEFGRAKRKYASGTKVIDVSAKNLAKIEIPLPPREEQDRIVFALDQLDTLANSPNSGIPAELLARRSQYEYYRNRLFAFKEAAA